MMIKKNTSCSDKSVSRKMNKINTSQAGKDAGGIYVPCKRTIKKQKSKLFLHTESNETKHDARSIKEYLKSKAHLNGGEIKSKHLNKQMREMVVEWVVQVAHKLKMKSQTLFHSIFLVDRVLGSERNIRVEDLQLLGASSLFVSSKYEEIYPPRADLYAEVTDFSYSKQKIIDMETSILTQIKFQLTFPTRYTFLTHLCNQKQDLCFSLALYLLELSLLELWEDVTESELAEAALFLSSKVLKKQYAGNKRICQLACKLMKAWKKHYGCTISYIFDCQEYCYVGGMFLETI